MNRNQLLKIGIKKKNKEISESWDVLAKKYGAGQFKDGESYRLWVKNRLKSNNDTQDDEIHKFKESVEIHKDGTHSSNKLLRMSIEESKDVNYLLRAHGYNTDAWELISAKNNIWNTYSKKDGIKTLYSSKISVRPKVNELSIEDIRNIFTEMSKDYKSPVYVPVRYNPNGKMLELNLADLHLGKLASTDANDIYNHEIARERFFYIIRDVLTRTSFYEFEKILFVFSNDFFHFDTISQTTTAGTRQDTTMRWQELFKMGVQMLVEAIDIISRIAPVETFYLGSNHDKTMSYYAIEYLSAWYRNNPNVKIDTDPKIRKYVEFGQCLIGFTHGHAEGKRIGKIMPIEAREAWGRTKYHEVHAAHFHSEKTTNEENGIIVRHVSSPTGIDNWHYENGYVGAQKKGESFVWDREKGLLDILFTTVE